MSKIMFNMFIFMLICLANINCERTNMTVKGTRQEIIECEIAEKKIIFGHQSVGYNLIDGLMMDHQLSCKDSALNVKETTALTDFEMAVFAHFRVGDNFEAGRKIAHFREVLESGLGNEVDIAGFKLCYVDILANTDVDHFLYEYIQTFELLREKFPHVKFVHFTVPLNVTPGGIKTRIKRLIGYPVWTDADNIKRNEFNEKLLKEFGSSVFDLARFESTYPNGKREFFIKNKKKIFTMVPEYAVDEGHLNEQGKITIGHELHWFFNNLLKE